MKRIAFLIAIVLCCLSGRTQDIVEGGKVWYSTYIYKKLNNRWFADAYLLNSHNVDGHSFSFNQNDFTINYRLNRKFSLMGGYSFSFYRWLPFYEDRYSQAISPFGTISFHKFSAGITHKFTYRELPFRFKHDFVTQYFVPKLEKYQVRLLYKFKLAYINKRWPADIEPFAQFFAYYYLNGTPQFYFEDEGEDYDYASPNGLHRFRVKTGVKFTPVKRWDFFQIALYYAYNKEFNIEGWGNPLNYHRPIPVDDAERYRQQTDLPFNNYHIFGLQFNFIFND